MSNEGIIVALALLIVAALWVGAPILRRESAQMNDNLLLQKKTARLLAYYERVLTNIRDLDEDHATGKINTASYALEREEWVLRGIEILKALDSLGAQITPVVPDEAAVEEAIDDEIEAAITAYRTSQAK